jgi:hypothetical protein
MRPVVQVDDSGKRNTAAAGVWADAVSAGEQRLLGDISGAYLFLAWGVQ